MDGIRKLIYFTKVRDILKGSGVPVEYVAAIENVRWDMAEKLQMDGGEGSGNFGHLGDPPNVGGSGGGGDADFCAVINSKSATDVQTQYGLNKNAIIHAKQAISKVTGGSVKEISNAQALYYIQNAKSKQNPGGIDKKQVIKELQENPGSLQLNKPTPSNPAASTTAVQDAIQKDAPNKAEAQKEALKEIAEETQSAKSESTSSENKPTAEYQEFVSNLNSMGLEKVAEEFDTTLHDVFDAKYELAETFGSSIKDVTNEQAVYYLQNINPDASPMDKLKVAEYLQQNAGNLNVKKPTQNSTDIVEQNQEAQQAATKLAEQNALATSLNNQTAAAIQKQYGLKQNAIVHAKQAMAKELGVKTGDITNAEALHYIQNVKSKDNPNGTPKAELIKNMQAAKANGSEPSVNPSAAMGASGETNTPAPSTPAGEAEGTASVGSMEIPESGAYITEDGSTRWGYKDYKKEAKKNASYTTNLDESLEHYDSLTKKTEAASTKAQHNATKKYTGSSYDEVNSVLNGLEKNIDDSTRKQIDNVTAYIDNSVTEEAIWMRRGTNDGQNKGMFGFSFHGKSIEEISEEIVGKEYVNGSFSSCRASKEKHGMTDGKEYIYDIHCPKGTRVAYVASFSNFHAEDEFIIQRGTTFKPTHVWEDKTGKIHVDMDVVEQIAPGAKLGKKFNENIYGKTSTTAWEKTSNGAKTSSSVKKEKGITAKLLSGGTPSMSELLAYTGLKHGTSMEKLKEAAKKKAEASKKA